MYEEVEERRSRLVPILTIVAAVLAIAVGIAVVLFFTGVFNHKAPTPGAQTAAAAPAPSDIAAARAADAEARSIQPTPAQGETTDVPKAVVALAPPGQGRPAARP